MAKASRSLTEELEEAAARSSGARKRTTKATAKVEEKAAANDQRFADIKANTFFKIIFNPSLSPEEKQKAVAEAQSSTGTKEENEARLEEFKQFKQYVQYKRQMLADHFMSLVDNDTFAVLQDVIKDMNTDILNFEEQMAPLLEVLDAVYKLRTAGTGDENYVLQAFKEIRDDGKKSEERKQRIDQIESQKTEKQNAIEANNRKILNLQQERGFLGMGGIPKKARQEIAQLERDNLIAQQEIRNLGDNLVSIQQEAASESSLPPELLESKEGLAQLLDLTAEEHSDRQQKLVDTARRFVRVSREKAGTALEKTGSYGKNVTKALEANGMLREVYAIMNEASVDASKVNMDKLNEIKTKLEDDSLGHIQRIELEKQEEALNDHIRSLDSTNKDTTLTLAELTEMRGNIQTMRDNNQTITDKTGRLVSSGIAGVADQLNVVLNGVSQAAINESAEALSEAQRSMYHKTRTVAGREVVKKVLGAQAENEALAKALNELNEFGKGMRAGTDAYKTEVVSQLNLMREMVEEAGKAHEAVREATQVHSSARAETDNVDQGAEVDVADADQPSAPATSDNADPFGDFTHS